MKDFDYSVVKHYRFYGFVKNVFGPIFKVMYKLKFKGLENVPDNNDERYIVAVNHTSAFDPVFVSIPKMFRRFTLWQRLSFLKIRLSVGLSSIYTAFP